MDPEQQTVMLSRIKREAERKGVTSLRVAVKASTYALVWGANRFALHCVQSTECGGERTMVNPALVSGDALLALEKAVREYRPSTKASAA